MEKKKILYIITKSNWGGAQKHVFDLATNFSQKDFDVVVALGGDGELKEKLQKENIKTISIQNLRRDVNVFSDFKVFVDLLKIIREEKPDILHVHSSKIGGLGTFAGRISKVKKIIFTAHGWPFAEDRNFIQKILIKLLSWLTVVFSQKTIVVSKKDKEIIENFPFVKHKLEIIYNSIQKIDFKTKEEARNTLLKEQKNDFLWIGTISELHKNKGLKYAIKAIDFLVNRKDEKIIFVIIGEGEKRKSLEKLINERSLENNVFLVGHKNEASKLLKAFDIFLLSSTKEGFPYAILEAGSANIPVVATKVGGIPEIILNDQTGILVRTKDPKDIASAIIHLLKNLSKQRIIKNNLTKKIGKDFNLEKMIDQTEKVYSG